MGDNKKMKKKYLKDNKIINKIEKARSKNNVYWMDILRLAIKFRPSDTKKILKKINDQDQKIASFLKKLDK
jgi:hypothetical protein